MYFVGVCVDWLLLKAQEWIEQKPSTHLEVRLNFEM